MVVKIKGGGERVEGRTGEERVSHAVKAGFYEALCFVGMLRPPGRTGRVRLRYACFSWIWSVHRNSGE